jgi:AcrR family transcriptional regulator
MTQMPRVETDHPRRRVAPLAPDDRRAALIEATLPLLVEHGSGVSTRQIAQAAGVAEGTIFRVFPDKSSLIIAALLAGTDPAPSIGALATIPPDRDLRVRLTAATAVLSARVRGVGRLHTLAREMTSDQGMNSPFAMCLHENRMRVVEALTNLIEPDRGRLRVPPATAARLLQSMIVAAHGHMSGEIDPMSADDIVTVLLDGLLNHPSPKESPC